MVGSEHKFFLISVHRSTSLASFSLGRVEMVDTFSVESRLHIREFDEGRDVKVVGKLERKCEIGTKKGVSIFTNMMADPSSRIRFYPLHVMLVGS